MASKTSKKKRAFKPVDSELSFPKIEKEILKFWKEKKIFEKSLKKNKGKENFVFYEGPPTANGRPGIHHLLARSFKDLFPRFQTMRGKHCLRKGGWDTHGLPVELEVEKELGISGKQKIENIVPGDKKASIIKFNKLCRKSVFRYVKDWENLTKRMGFWIDLDDVYVTLKPEYIESCWAILKDFYERGFLERDYKVVPYCPRCETPLSSHELSLGYEETEDDSLYLRFTLTDDEVDLLVWTTTPWTLPGNVALAVNPLATYVKVETEGKPVVLAKERIDLIKKPKIMASFRGERLVGKRYQPLYMFHDYGKKAYQILPAPFVSLEEGTGIVHTAVMYGLEDFELGKKHGLPTYHLVDEEGKFKNEVKPWASQPVKKAEGQIIKDLAKRGKLFKKETLVHSYPFCWRCKNPLLYYAIESWFIKTTKKKKEIMEENLMINWWPEHMKKGRMGKWLEGMVDWTLSRFRYWGIPLPIWRCLSCGSEVCLGSFAELEELTGKKLDSSFDPHKPYIDEMVGTCAKCQGEMRRYEEVIDVWFDSGAMPFAQWHYPFENRSLIEKDLQFPADFIAEGQDQTRGWFYTLLVISTLYKGRASFKNVISHNLVLDAKGQKMSKSLGNIVDPWLMMDRHGADAVRWYFYSGNLSLSYKFSEAELVGVSRRFLRILWNSANFFVMYALADKWSLKIKSPRRSSLRDRRQSKVKRENVLDKWILSRLMNTVMEVTGKLEKYDAMRASQALEELVSDLSRWYIRRSRERLGPSISDSEDKRSCYMTLYTVLKTLTKLLAPFTPFLAEEIYQNLKSQMSNGQSLSVHLEDWPTVDKRLMDSELEEKMAKVRRIVELGHAKRKLEGVPVRQPLSKLKIKSQKLKVAIQSSKYFKQLEKLILEELNIKAIEWREEKGELAVELDLKMTPELKREGEVRELVRKIQEARRKAGVGLDEWVVVYASAWPKEYEEIILRETLAKEIKYGKVIKVKRGKDPRVK